RRGASAGPTPAFRETANSELQTPNSELSSRNSGTKPDSDPSSLPPAVGLPLAARLDGESDSRFENKRGASAGPTPTFRETANSELQTPNSGLSSRNSGTKPNSDPSSLPPAVGLPLAARLDSGSDSRFENR